ncbi:hypothetical protein FNV43_RR16792 [Rhamnella rubrinervis]|uniref:Uncharacterized protein n=1 Tax=Rhamnella rubrinervis TaxID=2594499 RepID=A0A8K0GZF5_9ROSA|nr:hypothetical protein FNV43_RR16792 [Rhamnella rubrinervis]
MPVVNCRFISSALIHHLQLTGKRWQSLIGHIIMWFEACYKAVRKLGVFRRTFKTVAFKGGIFKNWTVREATGCAGRKAEKQRTPPPRHNNEGLTALISAANTALHSQFRAQVDKESVKRTSLGVINSSLQAMVTAQQLKNIKEELLSSRKSIQVLKGKCAKISLRNKDKEVEGLKNAIQELSTELDELRKEGNKNVMLGYNIMSRAVARKFPDCNMIELDQLSVEEARKGDQPASTPTDEPLQVEAGDQGVTEVGGKAAKTVVAEKASELPSTWDIFGDLPIECYTIFPTANHPHGYS